MIARLSTADEPRLRLAGPADLDAIVALTEAAYRPYTELFGAPPIPVTEDYAPRASPPARCGCWKARAGWRR